LRPLAAGASVHEEEKVAAVISPIVSPMRQAVGGAGAIGRKDTTHLGGKR